MLRQQIHDEMIAAMKAKDAKKLEAVRFVWSEIKNTEIDAKHELSDEEVVTLLKREVKRRKEALEQYTKAGRQDLIDKETGQLAVIETYLPAQMSEADIEKIIDEVMAEGMHDFGQVMREVMGKLKGKADGATVSRLVKNKI